MNRLSRKSPFAKATGKRRFRQSESGQIIIEYVLLLAIAVGLATLITKTMVGRGDQPGFVITAWQDLIKAIGTDLADAPSEQQK